MKGKMSGWGEKLGGNRPFIYLGIQLPAHMPYSMYNCHDAMLSKLQKGDLDIVIALLL